MKIIVDTREQLPCCNGERRTLNVGDYTTEKLHGHFHIERKSLQDLYGTITSGNRRFKYELFRAAYSQVNIAVYVEGTASDFYAKRFPKGNERKFDSEGLERLIKTFEKKYHLQFYWHRDRKHCAKEVEIRLKNEEKKFIKNKS